MTTTLLSAVLRRWLLPLVVLIGLVSTGTAVLAPPAQAAAATLSPYEGDLLARTNAARAGAGLAALTAQPGLVDLARQWASSLASRQKLEHNPNLVADLATHGAPGWMTAAENVGVGGSSAAVQQAYLNSPQHLANILLKGVSSVGIGVARSADGRVWDVVVFSSSYTASYGSSRTVVPNVSTSGAPTPGAPTPGAPTPGAPTGARVLGALDSAQSTVRGQLTVRGWEADPLRVGAVTQVHVYVTGPRGTAGIGTITTGGARPDVARVHPWVGGTSGFTGTVPTMGAGANTVCAFGISALGNVRLGCRTVNVRDAFGKIDQATVSGGVTTVAGWALNPNRPADAVQVHVYDTGPNGTTLIAGTGGVSRPDVARVYPGYGTQHGYRISVPAGAPGLHTLCTYAITAGGGDRNPKLGCKQVTVR